MPPQSGEAAKFPPRSASGRRPCQEVVRRDREVDLAELPIPVCWPEDGGPYITLPGVITRDPGTGVRNVGMRSEEHTSELQSLAYLVCRLLLEKKKRDSIDENHADR